MPPWPEDVSRVLVLHGPDQVAAALDIEARLSETGLLDVQLTDLRNMAHGRHVGLLSRAASTAVITLGDPGSRPLVDKTIAVLPGSIRVVDLSTELEGPAGSLDILVGCMRLVGEVGIAKGVDPGRPSVSSVGRKLYHLPWVRLAAGPDSLRPARVKAVAGGMSDAHPADLEAWIDAWHRWSGVVPVAEFRLWWWTTMGPASRRSGAPALPRRGFKPSSSGYSNTVCASQWHQGVDPRYSRRLRGWVPREYWESFKSACTTVVSSAHLVRL